MRGGASATSPSRKGIGRPGRVDKIMNAIYTQLVRRGRLVIMELVNSDGREHRIKDRELACGKASDHDASRAEALGGETPAGRVFCCGELLCAL